MSFWVKITDVDDWPCGANVIQGIGSFPTYRGRIKCDDIVLDVMEVYTAFVGPDDLESVTLNCVSKNATKDMIGKTFYSVDESEKANCQQQEFVKVESA